VRQNVGRDEILDVALEVFARNGYRGTNLKFVADRLDVTRQALYYHYRDKGEILGAVFSRTMTKMEEAVNDALAEADAGHGRFAQMLLAHCQICAENANAILVLLRERPAMRELPDLNAEQRRVAYTEQFIAAYADGVRQGQLNDFDPRWAANHFLASANAIAWWYRPGKGASPSEIAATVYGIMSDGFLRAGGKGQASGGPQGRARLGTAPSRP
jgi:AcrR family transcriptional regulator